MRLQKIILVDIFLSAAGQLCAFIKFQYFLLFLLINFLKLVEKHMKTKDKSYFYPNRIQISQFGAAFIKELPEQINDFQSQFDCQKQNVFSTKKMYKKRGMGINFQQFANRTIKMIDKSLKNMENSRSTNLDMNESKRKLQLNYDNWKNEQNLIKYKVSDTQARLQQIKFREYDWKANSISMKKQRNSILTHWQKVEQNKQKFLNNKLREIMYKKYPNRQRTIGNRKFVIKEYSK